ncbi:hypothetical protein C8J56DRAFT_1078241 [Mycena floridula]|nr:hypothetical protein C8J56DRAFT_1078241 [Mycena floridula]
MCGSGVESLIATPLPDGYWVNAFPYSTTAEYPDLIAYGLGSENVPASINRYLNPQNDPVGSKGWKVTEIQRLQFPIAMVYADLNDDNFNDIIIIDQFGTGTTDFIGLRFKLWGESQGGGRVQWLRNPGDISDPTIWEANYIGHSTGMHRLQVGHFTTKDHYEVMGLPILSASSDLKSPAPVILYSPSYGTNKTEGPQSWSEDNIFPSQFRMIHDTKLIPGANGLDMVLVAGMEGIVLLWFDEKTSKWEYNIVGTGLPASTVNPYHGSGSVDVASVGDDSVGYIAASEGFHGNAVSIYVKNSTGVKGPESLKQNVWKRIQIDSFGPLDNTTHTGTIHSVHTVKTGDSAFDSFGIACLGAPNNVVENQGVYVYSPTNLTLGRFTKTKLTDKSAAQLAVAAFVDKDRLDVASISYSLPSYHVSVDPSSVRINTFGNSTNNCPATVVSPIKTTVPQ